MTASEQLRKAADLIEERGHIQRSFGDERVGPICMIRALSMVEGVSPYGLFQNDTDPMKALGMSGPAICYFNNTHTKEEVVAELRDTADRHDREPILV